MQGSGRPQPRPGVGWAVAAGQDPGLALNSPGGEGQGASCCPPAPPPPGIPSPEFALAEKWECHRVQRVSGGGAELKPGPGWWLGRRRAPGGSRPSPRSGTGANTVRHCGSAPHASGARGLPLPAAARDGSSEAASALQGLAVGLGGRQGLTRDPHSPTRTWGLESARSPLGPLSAWLWGAAASVSGPGVPTPWCG